MGGAVLSLVALAQWQRTEDATALVAAAAGLSITTLLVRSLRRPRLPGLAAMLAIAVALVLAVLEQRAAADLARAGERWALAARNRDVARVGDAIEAARETLWEAADAALRSGQAAEPVVRGAETALAVFENGQLSARAGQSRIVLRPAADGVVFEQSAFYGLLIVRRQLEQRSVVATVLLTAAPPTDRFAPALVSSTVPPELATSIRLDWPSALSFLDPDDPTQRAIGVGRRGAPPRPPAVGGSAPRSAPELADPGPVLVVSAAPRSLEEARLTNLQRARVRTSLPLAVASVLVLMVGWRRPARLRERLVVVLALLTVVALLPLGALSNVSPLFSAANYFSPVAGSLTANIAALIIAALLALLALFRVLRSTRRTQSRRLALLLVLGSAVLGPFALRDLARGIAFSPSGPGVGLWIAWQLGLALAAAGILIAVASVGQGVIGQRRGLPASIGPMIAAACTVAAPLLWLAPGAWPEWFIVPWVVAIAMLAFVRRGRALVTAVAFVAGCGAVTLTWGATTRTRMALAESDVPRLVSTDVTAYPLLGRFAETLTEERGAPDRARLLRVYAASDLARAGYPARLAIWEAQSATTPAAVIELVAVSDVDGVQSGMARTARLTGGATILAGGSGAFTILVAAVPFGVDTVVTIAVPPRTSLLSPDPFSRLTGVAATADRAPPYTLSSGALAAGARDRGTEAMRWKRTGSRMLGEATVVGEGDSQASGGNGRRVQVEVELRGLDVLIPRGALLVLLDVAVVLLLWTASAMADGGMGRWLRWQWERWRRSYRARLSIAMLGFFLAPAAVFSLWEAYRLREDDRNARELLVREALRSVAIPVDSLSGGSPALLTTEVLADMATGAGGPLFAYRDGMLLQASDPVLAELAPFGTLLPAGVPSGVAGELARVASNGDAIFTQLLPVLSRSALVGFRPTVGPEGSPFVVATAARGDELALDARRADLAILVLLVILVGVLAALWLSGAAARQLARPIGTLRDAALAIAGGRPMPPLGELPPAEFVPVFGAFARMATDLSASRTALEDAQRRTAAVLREVASGVVAVRHDGTVLLANPRAEQLLATTLTSGAPVVADAWWQPVATRLRDFVERPQRAFDAFDVTVPAAPPDRGERQLRASLTRLPGGAVLTLDDVTELATAQRVLAWGEMARQVAHEIKNPLTPIRLGVQHLRRAWRDGRADFGAILDTNVARILEEIDHLDEIARAFSRYGSVPAERAPGEPTDVARVAASVVELERMGEEQVQWELRVSGTAVRSADDVVPPVFAIARADELREVLLNLLENGRLANASRVELSIARTDAAVVIRVHDDGDGMDPATIPRIFEPHFSTRTSGSGLGLAISRRMLDGWGGTITVESTPRVGTTLTVSLVAS